MDNYKSRRTTNDANSIHNARESSALDHGHLNDARYVIRKTDSPLPFIPCCKRRGECDCALPFDGRSKSRSCRAFNKQTPSSTTQAQQLMPTGFKQFWLQYKPSLAIQPSTFYQDVDTFSIEMIREHNEPHLVLPSLREKLK